MCTLIGVSPVRPYLSACSLCVPLKLVSDTNWVRKTLADKTILRRNSYFHFSRRMQNTIFFSLLSAGSWCNRKQLTQHWQFATTQNTTVIERCIFRNCPMRLPSTTLDCSSLFALVCIQRLTSTSSCSNSLVEFTFLLFCACVVCLCACRLGLNQHVSEHSIILFLTLALIVS